MSATRAVEFDVGAEFLDMADLERLGEAWGRTWLRLDGERELEITRSNLRARQLEDKLTARERFVRERQKLPRGIVERPDGDGVMTVPERVEERWHRGSVHPAGTFARESARFARATEARQSSRSGPRPHLPLDRLARIPGLRARASVWHSLTRTPDPTRALLGRGPSVVRTSGRPAVTDLDGLLTRLAEDGIRIEAHAGHLLLRAPGAVIAEDLVTATDALRPLILAHLAGTPLRCALPHTEKQPPPAVTVLVSDVPSCASHATESAQ